MERHTVTRLTLATLFAIALSSHATADTITFGGSVAAAPGGTSPAVNNPSLNNIQDDDSYLVTLGFTGSITAPGTYPLPGASLVFSDLNESAGESSFSSVSLSVVTDGAYYDLSLLGCLSTGSGCLMGNSLSANFRIPSSDLNSTNVSAQSTPFVDPPLDLLEDDGNTEYQGFVDRYSYHGTTATRDCAFDRGIGSDDLVQAASSCQGAVKRQFSNPAGWRGVGVGQRTLTATRASAPRNFPA